MTAVAAPSVAARASGIAAVSRPMIGVQFHHDLLTPGIVSKDDPAPIESGMISSHSIIGDFSPSFEAIPPQVEESPERCRARLASAPDLAGLDTATLQTATRSGTGWPPRYACRVDRNMAGKHAAVRVEAAAHRGRPVWLRHGHGRLWNNKPWRTRRPSAGQETIGHHHHFGLALAILIGGGVRAQALREGRGDRRGGDAWMWIVGGAVGALGMPGPRTGDFAMLGISARGLHNGVLWRALLGDLPGARTLRAPLLAADARVIDDASKRARSPRSHCRS